MKYTLDSPNMAFEAFVQPLERIGRPLEKWTVGVLLRLPNADMETTEKFLTYGMDQWGYHQPSFCVLKKEPGALVFPWNGEPIEAEDQDHLEWKSVGVLQQSKAIVSEIASIDHTILYIKMTQAVR